VAEIMRRARTTDPLACVVFVAVLLAAWLPLPGAVSLIAAVLVPVWALQPDLIVVAIHDDRPQGVEQPLACVSPPGTRGPPVSASR
jgi:hypothetical protein